MICFRIIIFLPTSFLFSSVVYAEGFWKTAWDDFTSPVTTDAKYYLYGGSALTGILVIDGIEDSLGHDVQNETTENKPLGKFSVVGDIAGQLVPNLIYSGAYYLVFKNNGDNLAYQRSTHMFKATIYSSAVTNILKYSIREKRPDSDNRDSFPSGHSTSAFAFAAVVATEHEWYFGVAAFGLAGLVAYSRINDNAHDLYDVVGGAVIGFSYGLGLHYLYKDKDSIISKTSIIPYGSGLGFSFRTNF